LQWQTVWIQYSVYSLVLHNWLILKYILYRNNHHLLIFSSMLLQLFWCSLSGTSCPILVKKWDSLNYFLHTFVIWKISCTVRSIVCFTLLAESETDWSSPNYDCLVCHRNYSILVLCSSFGSKYSVSIAVVQVCIWTFQLQ